MLDALRGMAALSVFFHHTAAISAPLAMPAAYRAVDLFFILSGFVIDRAYGARLATRLTTGDFLRLRVARLYPLYLLGAMIGIGQAVLAWWLGGGDLDLVSIMLAGVSLVLFLPSPTWRWTQALMPLNVPAWSLTLELVANALYALGLRRLGKAGLLAIVLACMVWLVAESHLHRTSNLGADWSTLRGGFARVGFSFFLGVLIARTELRSRTTRWWGWLMPVCAFVPLCLWPENEMADLICLLAVFPCFIVFGVMVDAPAKWIAALMGDVSYALYVLHVPAVFLVYKMFSFLGCWSF
jgi:peptidoglycan/LPS O-acetylase OafA/YrhL